MNSFDKDDFNFPAIEEISSEIPAVSEFCNVTRLSELFEMFHTDTLPVIDLQGKIIGIVSEFDLAQIVPEWSLRESGYQCNIKVFDIMTNQVWTETKNTNVKDLIDKINKMHTRVIPLVDKDGYYTGSCITRSSIISYLARLIKPSTLGGLATPLGVYITDGKHQAGAGNLGLFMTGVSLGVVLWLIEQSFAFSLKQLHIQISSENTAVFPIIFILQIFMFLVILRLTPLAKIHAAEHQTINAIEKGLPLTLETVKMQPREHKRCGTNLMVLFIGIQLVMLLFIGYLQEVTSFFQFIFLFGGFMFVFSNWRRWGMWLQKYFTTVKAPDSYIINGIKTGEEILNKHKNDFDAKPASFLRKLWCMSIIQIISGFISVQWFFNSILKVLSFIK